MKISWLLLLFILIVNTKSFSRPPGVEKRVYKTGKARATFHGGVLYKIEDIGQGLKDMWKASGCVNEGLCKENLGLFTSQGLLVLPNKGNSYNHVMGSLKFLGSLINGDHTKVIFQGEEIEILGMVHTHPNFAGIMEHTPYAQVQFEWNWTAGKIGNYVLATDGIYQAQLDYLTSKWIGYKVNKVYQLIINKYYLNDNNKILY
ncbi:hypothetical protein WSM22_00910 [Cytophagales bacterium WSM2-2]|nr:hypothetical protein WSM22_00910 [Cytophagales bacterium WSM2-2]